MCDTSCVHSVGLFLNMDSTMHDGKVWKFIVKQRLERVVFCHKHVQGITRVHQRSSKHIASRDQVDDQMDPLFPSLFYDDLPTKL